MKTGLFALTILVAGFIVQYFFPWWTIALVCFAAGFYFSKNPAVSFLIGFLAVMILWTAYALFLNFSNGGILYLRMQALLGEFIKKEPIGYMAGVLNFLLFGGLGALVGGMSAMTGAIGRRAFF